MMRVFPAALSPASAMLRLCLLGAMGLTSPEASTQDNAAVADLNRGRALYGASCDACHTQNIHWRDKGLVTSWASLVNEVKRWQSNSGQRWKQDEINDVAAYLNERFYRLPCPPAACMEKQAAVLPIPPRQESR